MRRQPDFATQPRPSRWRAVAAAMALVGLLALVTVTAAAWRARVEVRQAGIRLAETQRELARQNERLRVLARRPEAAATARAATAPPARIVAAIAAVLPDEARLERLTIDYRDLSLEMQVVARSASGWDRLLEALERAPEFRAVAPGPESRAAEVRSSIRAHWAAAAVGAEAVR